MSPLVIVIAGSAVLLLGFLLLAVVCACVLAGRADDYLDAAYESPQALLVALDDVTFDWPAREAEIVPFPAVAAFPGRTAFPSQDTA